MQPHVLIVSYTFTQSLMKPKRCLFSRLVVLRNEKKNRRFGGFSNKRYSVLNYSSVECSGLGKTSIILPHFFRELLFISI